MREKVADGGGLWVTVGPYSRGASKWHPVENRLFGYLSITGAATPLRTVATLLACIRGTKTQTGLRVRATLVRRTYCKGIKVPDEEMETLRLHKHSILPDWNDTLQPRWTIFELLT